MLSGKTGLGGIVPTAPLPPLLPSPSLLPFLFLPPSVSHPLPSSTPPLSPSLPVSLSLWCCLYAPGPVLTPRAFSSRIPLSGPMS